MLKSTLALFIPANRARRTRSSAARSILALQAPAKDTATAHRLHNYQCLLWGSAGASNEESVSRSRVIPRRPNRRGVPVW